MRALTAEIKVGHDAGDLNWIQRGEFKKEEEEKTNNNGIALNSFASKFVCLLIQMMSMMRHKMGNLSVLSQQRPAETLHYCKLEF